MRTRRPWLAVAGVALATATCHDPSLLRDPAAPPPPPTEAPAAHPAPAPPNPAPAGLALLHALPVAPEAGAGYDRSRFRHWSDLDGDGCDTRQEVLVRESEGPVQRDPYGRCPTVVAGDWTSIYDGKTVTDPGELDIDHIVALAEAWQSGAAGWDDARREAFANYEPGLVAVTASVNRSKGADDPAEWLPPDPATWCWYADVWVHTKAEWGLSVDQAEADALADVLAGC